MSSRWPVPVVLLSLLSMMLLVSGCLSGGGRDLSSEAADREAYAKDHDDFEPVAILSGPQTIQPGSLVWYTAKGSHDPDFIGAKREREESHQAGGVHYTDDTTGVSYSWNFDVVLDDGGSASLGNGIREYRWQLDDGPVLVAPELTTRYGTEDGPVRFPVGFVDAGTHTLRLTVVDWSGERDHAVATFEVADGGVGSAPDLDGFAVTESGWTKTLHATVNGDDYGDCWLGRNTYDATQDRVRVPWDVLFFTEDMSVDVTWERPAVDEGPLPPEATTSPINTNDIDMTIGHCGQEEGRFHRFATDQDPLSDGWEGGDIDMFGFVDFVDKTGHAGELLAEWDHDLYTSDDGYFHGGTGADVHVTYLFVPARDTSSGGL